ncbi:hypothetical protein WL77_26485 [Burkholderia ubonensis]|nr:hypothetical protein WL77_26485 [Burkholderia ubonensis]KWE78058.1 hypothetical protein WL79_05945 [Burkholderia ubonensis]
MWAQVPNNASESLKADDARHGILLELEYKHARTCADTQQRHLTFGTRQADVEQATLLVILVFQRR